MILKNDIKMYDGVGARIEELVGEYLGKLNRPNKPIYITNGVASYSFILEENKDIYLYLKNIGNNFNFEIKYWKNQKTVSRFNIDMKNIKDIVIGCYEEVTQSRDYNKDITDIFNMSPTTNSKVGFGNQSPF